MDLAQVWSGLSELHRLCDDGHYGIGGQYCPGGVTLPPGMGGGEDKLLQAGHCLSHHVDSGAIRWELSGDATAVLLWKVRKCASLPLFCLKEKAFFF